MDLEVPPPHAALPGLVRVAADDGTSVVYIDPAHLLAAQRGFGDGCVCGGAAPTHVLMSTRATTGSTHPKKGSSGDVPSCRHFVARRLRNGGDYFVAVADVRVRGACIATVGRMHMCLDCARATDCGASVGGCDATTCCANYVRFGAPPAVPAPKRTVVFDVIPSSVPITEQPSPFGPPSPARTADVMVRRVAAVEARLLEMETREHDLVTKRARALVAIERRIEAERAETAALRDSLRALTDELRQMRMARKIARKIEAVERNVAVHEARARMRVSLDGDRAVYRAMRADEMRQLAVCVNSLPGETSYMLWAALHAIDSGDPVPDMTAMWPRIEAFMQGTAAGDDEIEIDMETMEPRKLWFIHRFVEEYAGTGITYGGTTTHA